MGRRLVTLALMVALAGCSDTGQSGETPQGSPQTGKTSSLEAGANLMQDAGPAGKLSMHLVGFHPSKADPSMQMESHHYCNQVNEDFAQCVLFDGDKPSAWLHGVEYIISAKLYDTLPAGEKAYWHPHNYEILSGTLRMPRLPDAAEKEAMRTKINSYGKTWHTWKTGVYERDADPLPLGPPHLAWSFNYDGEAMPGLVESRDGRYKMNSGDERKDRGDLASLAQPQGGVDAMKDRFPNRTGTINGVRDNGDTSVAAVPMLMMQPAAPTAKPAPPAGNPGGQ